MVQVLRILIDFCGIAREQVWILPGFQVSAKGKISHIASILTMHGITRLHLQEQLVLFELCQYNPNPNEGIYKKWRQKIERQLK